MEAVCEIVGFEEASESVEGLVTESEGVMSQDIGDSFVSGHR